VSGAVFGETEREESDVVVACAFKEVMPEGGRVRRKGGIWGIVGRTSLHTTTTDKDGKVVMKPYEL
jgi:hypothetical protein